MRNKEKYESPKSEVFGVDLKAIVCVSERNVSVQADTTYEFTEEDW